MIGGRKGKCNMYQNSLQVEVFFEKMRFFLGNKGKEQKNSLIHPAMPKVERPFQRDMEGKKKTPPYLRRLGGAVLMYNFKFPKKQAIFTDSHEKKNIFIFSTKIESIFDISNF